MACLEIVMAAERQHLSAMATKASKLPVNKRITQGLMPVSLAQAAAMARA